MLFEADYAKNYASIMYQCLFERGGAKSAKFGCKLNTGTFRSPIFRTLSFASQMVTIVALKLAMTPSNFCCQKKSHSSIPLSQIVTIVAMKLARSSTFC